MSEVSERYRAIADGFTARLVGIAPEQWSAGTPCSDWTVRDLVGHVVYTHRGVLCTLEGAKPAPVASGDDLPGAFRVESEAVMAVLDDGERAATVVGGVFGEQPFEALVGRLLCADTLVHTWDLARATGQDERLDSRAVAKAMQFLVPIDDSIRRPGGFAAKLEPAPDADEQERLLNFCGRAV